MVTLLSRRQLLLFAGSHALVASVRAALPTGTAESYPQTKVERDAGVMPMNMGIANGPLRYGAIGNGAANDQGAWAALGKVSGFHFVGDGVYKFDGKVQTQGFITVEGATRQNTVILATGFPDYVLEVGSQERGPNPNVGALQRLRFMGGSTANKGMLHMQRLSHMWRLDDLLFQKCECPALILDNCWDSNYTNIDILSCGNTRGDPASNAAVIVRNGSNNIYFRGLRVEQCPSGCLYVGEDSPFPNGTGAIYLVTGKMDMGFIRQYAPCITVANDGQLCVDDYEISGITKQYVFDIRGQLKIGNLEVGGASGMPAALFDGRGWQQINPSTVKGGAAGAYGPYMPVLDLGRSYFQRGSIFVNQQTRAVVQSKVFPVRFVTSLTVTANGQVGEESITIGTNLPSASNNTYDGCYLVLNRSGNAARSRRKILTSIAGGNLVLQGMSAVQLGDDYSIEFCGNHATPMFLADGVQMDSGMDLFAVLHAKVAIAGTPTYVPSSSSAAAAGVTLIAVSDLHASAAEDWTGYSLVDDVTGEPFLIGYGLDRAGRIGVMYDRAAALDAKHTYSVVCGYSAGVAQRGSYFEWTFAGRHHSISVHAAAMAGFDRNNIPLWSFVASESGSDHLNSDG